MNVSQIAYRLREQMCSFLGDLRLRKPVRRFVLEALYGILTRQSVMLTEIARSLNEGIPLIKTENRLSRQAARKGLAEKLTRFVIGEGARRMKEERLLIIDPSDIAKPYGQKMQYLARVRDGSTGELANGYWLCQVVAVACGAAGQPFMEPKCAGIQERKRGGVIVYRQGVGGDGGPGDLGV